MKRQEGQRVFAIASADPKTKTVRLFGFGRYVGDEIPDAGAGGFATVANKARIPNPKIVLDGGPIVWGGECWWGPESAFAKHFPRSEWKVETVDIAALRADECAALASASPSGGESTPPAKGEP